MFIILIFIPLIFFIFLTLKYKLYYCIRKGIQLPAFALLRTSFQYQILVFQPQFFITEYNRI